MLVVQGANDPRVLQVESDEIVAAVRANGVPVEYVLFDDEGHGFTKREKRIAASEAYVKFLDAHLQAGEQPPQATDGRGFKTLNQHPGVRERGQGKDGCDGECSR